MGSPDPSLTVGYRLSRIPPVSKQPDIKAAYCRAWRGRKKLDPAWVEAERARGRAAKSAKRKAQCAAAARRYRARKKRDADERARRELLRWSPSANRPRRRVRDEALLNARAAEMHPELRASVAAGSSIRAAATAFGVSYKTACRACSGLGVNRRPVWKRAA